jgi:CheY-like chemotaxis protein
MKGRPKPDRSQHKKSRKVRSLIVRGAIPAGREPARRKMILVVDDEPAVAGILMEVVREDNCAVDSAVDGEEALEKLRERTYDVILCDIRMPRLNGMAFYRAIARWKPQLLRRVVFITGDILGPETQAFLAQADAPVLEKPFKIQDVLSMIRRF